MVTLALLTALTTVPLPQLSTTPGATGRIGYNECVDVGYYRVTPTLCCPFGSYLTNDGYCARDGSQAEGLGILLIAFLLFAWGMGWLAEEESDDAELPELEIGETVDPERLLAELEAKAPAGLSEIEKIEWAAREGARIIAGKKNE